MHALVVYESMFGNTEAVARAVADGLVDRLPVEVVEVGEAPIRLSEDVALLVVGGPTHAFGMTRPSTRQDAVDKAERPVISQRSGLREWLPRLRGSRTAPAAAFDTRVSKPRLPGSAAHAVQRRLRRLGFPIATPAASFWVSGTKGPLLDSERERACGWGRELGERFAAEQPGSVRS